MEGTVRISSSLRPTIWEHGTLFQAGSMLDLNS